MKAFIGVVALAAVVAASPMLVSPGRESAWTGTALEDVFRRLRVDCSRGADPYACAAYRALGILGRGALEVTESDGRSQKTESDVLDQIEDYIRSHDVVAFLPGSYFEGTSLTLSAKNLDKNELSLNLKFPEESPREGKAVEAEGRKTKLKKIIVPVLVFVLLKAMTLIPLAIGVLGIKAWNALQLSFFSFVISVALAIFQLCKKIASDHTAQVAAHGPWDNYQAAHYAARAFSAAEPHGLAYSAHVPS